MGGNRESRIYKPGAAYNHPAATALRLPGDRTRTGDLPATATQAEQRRTNHSHGGHVNELRLGSMEQIADAATDDVFARLNAVISDAAEKMGQGERDAIAALMGQALTEQVGIEVLRGSYLDGNTFRWKTQVRLDPDIPAGEVRYRSGITKGDL